MTISIRIFQQPTPASWGLSCVAISLPNVIYDTLKTTMIQLGVWPKYRKTLRTKLKHLIALWKTLSLNAEIESTSTSENINPLSVFCVNFVECGFHWILVLKDISKFLFMDPFGGKIYDGEKWADDEQDNLLPTASKQYIFKKSC